MNNTPEAHRQAYRDRCDFRRNGAAIDVRTADNNWTRSEDFLSINATKRAIRRGGLTTYTIR